MLRRPHIFRNSRRRSAVGIVTNTNERDSAGSLHDDLDLGYIKCIQALGDSNGLSLRGYIKFCCGAARITHTNVDISDDVVKPDILDFSSRAGQEVENNNPTILVGLPLYLTLVSLLLYNQNIAKISGECRRTGGRSTWVQTIEHSRPSVLHVASRSL